MIKLGIYNKDNQIVREKFDPKYELPDRLLYGESEEAVHIGSRKIALQEGDFIRLEVDQPNQYIWVKFDDTFEPSLVYIKDAITWDYQIPFEQLERSALKDTSFTGNGHYIYARYAYDFEISQYRNLALNRHANISTKGYTHMHRQMSKREMTQLSLLVMQLTVFGQMMITELTPINLGVLTNKMMRSIND
ncbi:hypothetical protein MGH68_00965 [Erysipelothrix sp. D19-032]